MTPEMQKQVQKLQDNLCTIRLLAGWKAEDLADLLDVTRQTVYNLERGKPKMSLIQYLAIRTVIDDEIVRNPENSTLRQAVLVLLDDQEIPDEEKQQLSEALKVIAQGMAKKNSDSKAGMKLVATTLGAASTGVIAGLLTRNPVIGVSTWMSAVRAINDFNKK